MDKNTLMEYQKRVEDMLVTLEKYQTIIDEGIEESQRRTDTRLAELQVRREELEQPIDMSDISATVIDRRATIDREYSDDREGYLLREYDKRRLDGYEGPKYAEIVEEIRTIRENRRLEQKEAVEAEMQALIAEQADIDNARDVEAKRVSTIIQLQEVKDEIEANIQSKKDEIKKSISKFDEAYAEANIHKQALTLYKDPNSKVYTAAKVELERCTKQAETAQTKVKRLVRKISHLEQDLTQVDKLLDSLSNSRKMDEVTKQEEKVESQQPEVSESQETAELQQTEEQAPQEPAEPQQPTEPEQPKASEEPANPNPVQPTATSSRPQETVNTQQQKKSKTQGTDKQQVSTESKSQSQLDDKKDKWKVESVAFTVEGGIQPVYKVIVSNGKEQKEFTSTEISVLDTEFDSDEIKELVEGKKISQPEKCYDKGLATLLTQIDSELTANSLEEYQAILRYPRRYKDCIKIDYDFSQLKGKVSKEMKKLQKIARECGKKGVAIYQKEPNIFQRIWRSLKNNVKLLKETPLEPNTSAERLRKVKMMEEMEEGLEDRPYELDIDNLKEYSDFSPEVAQEQLEKRAESIEELAHLDDTIDAARKWRKENKIDVSAIKTEDESPKKEEQPVKANDVIKVEQADVTVLDRDGNEIG